MTGNERDRPAAAPGGVAPVPPVDASHLDEDPECLEDPVHCGDAHHQHEAHRRADADRPGPRS